MKKKTIFHLSTAAIFSLAVSLAKGQTVDDGDHDG